MGGLLGGLLGGDSGSQVVYVPPPAAAPPPPAAAGVNQNDTITPVEGLDNRLKKPRTKGLLTGETLGGSTLLGS